MSFQITLAELEKIIDASGVNISSLPKESSITGISCDTRLLKKGDAFLALRGEKFDGHDFVKTAIQNGAIALIVSKPSADLPANVAQFHVGDTLEAYQNIASWWRDRFSIPAIGVTGSVGKTTTKELIAAVLSLRAPVLKTEANYNNEIGVPKTLLHLDTQHQYAVIEMAMRAAGEIALLTKIARPTIGVITNVGTAHIGRLGSREAIAAAKCELLANMPASSVAILNRDDRLLMETAAKVWQGETVTYGLEGGDICGEWIDSQTLRIEGRNLPLPLKGRHNASNYLAALAVAKVLGINLDLLVEGLSVNLPEGRSKFHSLDDDIAILDETYNAGLESTLAALYLLKETPGKRHFAVLGAMKELGENSDRFHRQVGETAKQLGVDGLLVMVDHPEAAAIADGAKGISTECFATQDELVTRLQDLVRPGDRLLFKASHSVGLNRAVERVRALFFQDDRDCRF